MSATLICPECSRHLEAEPCGFVHAVTRLQIDALRKMTAALFDPRPRMASRRTEP